MDNGIGRIVVLLVLNTLLLSSCLTQRISRIEVLDIPCLGNYEQRINVQNIRTISVVERTDIEAESIQEFAAMMYHSKMECVEVDALADNLDSRIVLFMYNKKNRIVDVFEIDYNHSIYRNSRYECENKLVIPYLRKVLPRSDCFDP